MSDIVCRPIGVIRTPHKRPEDTPVQPVFAKGVPGRVAPLLDVRPYVGRFDSREEARSGWQDDVDEETARERGRRGFRRDGG